MSEALSSSIFHSQIMGPVTQLLSSVLNLNLLEPQGLLGTLRYRFCSMNKRHHLKKPLTSDMKFLVDSHDDKSPPVVLEIGGTDNFLSGGEAHVELLRGTELRLMIRPLVMHAAQGLEREAFETRQCR